MVNKKFGDLTDLSSIFVCLCMLLVANVQSFAEPISRSSAVKAKPVKIGGVHVAPVRNGRNSDQQRRRKVNVDRPILKKKSRSPSRSRNPSAAAQRKAKQTTGSRLRKTGFPLDIRPWRKLSKKKVPRKYESSSQKRKHNKIGYTNGIPNLKFKTAPSVQKKSVPNALKTRNKNVRDPNILRPEMATKKVQKIDKPQFKAMESPVKGSAIRPNSGLITGSIVNTKAKKKSVKKANKEGKASPIASVKASRTYRTEKVSKMDNGNSPPLGWNSKMIEHFVRKYCFGNANMIMNGRIVWQKQQLKTMSVKLAKQVKLLEKKILLLKKLKTSLKKDRASASAKVVDIFSRMRPDAAALQLSAMPVNKAKRILLALQAKKSSLILNEMTPNKAARLAELLMPRANGRLK